MSPFFCFFLLKVKEGETFLFRRTHNETLITSSHGGRWTNQPRYGRTRAEDRSEWNLPDEFRVGTHRRIRNLLTVDYRARPRRVQHHLKLHFPAVRWKFRASPPRSLPVPFCSLSPMASLNLREYPTNPSILLKRFGINIIYRVKAI